jgi:hypothetical protein
MPFLAACRPRGPRWFLGWRTGMTSPVAVDLVMGFMDAIICEREEYHVAVGVVLPADRTSSSSAEAPMGTGGSVPECRPRACMSSKRWRSVSISCSRRTRLRQTVSPWIGCGSYVVGSGSNTTLLMVFRPSRRTFEAEDDDLGLWRPGRRTDCEMGGGGPRNKGGSGTSSSSKSRRPCERASSRRRLSEGDPDDGEGGSSLRGMLEGPDATDDESSRYRDKRPNPEPDIVV